MHGLAVHEPEMVDAAGGWTGGVEQGDGARSGRVADVEDLEPRRAETNRLRLVGHHHIEGVGPQAIGREVGLHDDRGLARIGDVHRREVLGSRLVSEPEDSPLITGQLNGHAFAAVAEAVQLMMGQQRHVPGF